MWKVVFTRLAAKDAEKLRAAHLNAKAKELIDIIRSNPFVTPPPYEKLLGNFEGAYSRRINIKHRLVYQVISEELIEKGNKYEGTIKILSLWSHYER